MARQQPKRRGHGEGSIYQRKDGRWVAEITLEDGNRKPLYGKTRKEVADKLATALQEQKQGILAKGPRQTVRQFLEQWFEEVHKQEVRISTYKKHCIILNKHILPTLGHLQLRKLVPQHLQRLYAEKAKEGLAPGSIKNIHKVLRSALTTAVRWSLVAQNVCDLVTPPREKKHDAHTLTKEQAMQLLRAAQGHDLEAFIALALTTGMRHGEMLALRWQDIDFDNHCLQVRHTVYRVGGMGTLEGEPKTEQSKREIMLAPFVTEGLKAHRTRQLAVRLRAGTRWQERGLVFCNRHGGFVNAELNLKRFRLVLREAGLPEMRIHDLRHTAASLLILSMNAPANLVQELLGHSQVSTTLSIYTHSDLSMQRKMMDDLNDLLGGL